MIRALRAYVAVVDRFNHALGRFVMFAVFFALLAVLIFSSVSKTFFTPTEWTLEMAQFLMVGYFILGGPYALQVGAHVRMDLIYGEFGPRRRALTDCVTVLFLLVYLGVLLWGGIDSTIYSFQYGGERSASAWRPYLWPIKVTMCVGIALMLLQALSELAKDILFLSTGTPLRHQTEEPGDAL